MAKIKELKEKISKITVGAFSSLTDLVLFFLVSGYESVVDPRFLRSLPYTLMKADKIREMIDVSKMKRALRHVKEKGWVDEELKISKSGEQRLKDIFPVFPVRSSWDEKWYLVNFDVPEKFTRKRNILREKLKRLGFARLQNSVWISPYDFLGNVEKIIKEYQLEPYVIFSISPKVGPLKSKELAERIWNLGKVQEEHKAFIKKYEASRQKFSPFEIVNDYRRICEQDPQLPKELLPDDWEAEKTFRIYASYLKFKPRSS
ncbi:MAG: CRISPR-associated endonuclease Cas2 [Candidatus Wildermuthbacteria bacterium GWA2_46_15]|uniref:CRISPR-associated endoribonuclease Cas2 n=1 Tax=Candidatus Wildermuthbacteria bacterium GWA2_46_15 TaxID=1802443 RepID=A0A1G2QNY2_9BACT|nr:MAG: CRISPR-associated endonuclease Cas2 [Candidatus Wildermuthbacteria bacterium GWA2_46_15]